MNESERIAALRSLNILDSAPEVAFDELTNLAAYIANTPIALVSFVDVDRQWFKSRVGLDVTETPRDVSVCAHCIAEGANFTVPNALNDPRFAESSLVLDGPQFRFYFGVPLQTSDGFFVGTLCVLDRVPRELEPEQIRAIETISKQVIRLVELRRTSDFLLLENASARSFFETSIDMMCVANFDGYFEDLNRAWSDALGWSVDELKSRPFLEFVHPNDRASVQSVHNKLKAGTRTNGFQARFVHKNGAHRWLQFNASVGSDERKVIAVARDVTDQRIRAASLEAARDEAERSNNAKTAFLANMSHELRTPLNSIIGYSSVMLEDGDLGELPTSHVSRIIRNGKHLLSLLDDILDISTIESGSIRLEPESVPLDALVEEVCDSFASLVDRKPEVVLVRDVPPGLDPVIVDPRRLRQVLVNLVANAIKFTTKGRVTIRIVAKDHVPMKLEVSDTGIGISHENLARILKPFEQEDQGTARKYGGTGLGLSISESLVESMGFLLEIRSTLGEGSIFTIRLDNAERDSVPTVPHQQLQPRVILVVGGSRLLRLIADAGDHPTVSFTVVDSLEKATLIMSVVEPSAVIAEAKFAEGPLTNAGVPVWIFEPPEGSSFPGLYTLDESINGVSLLPTLMARL